MVYELKDDQCLSLVQYKHELQTYSLQNDLNPFPNKPWFLRVCSTSLLKTLEKEKLLVTSNQFFLPV